MKLKDFLAAADSRVCGGSNFQWECYGPNAQYMDVSDILGNEVGSCIFDRVTQTVYQVEMYVNDDSVAYRWIDPDWSLEYGIEAERRNVNKFIAYDDIEFTQVETETEILDLAHRIVHNTYVHSMPIDSKNLNPTAAWPFPTGDTPASSEQTDVDLDGTDADWGHSDDEDYEYNNDEGMCGFDVDAFRAMAGDGDPVEPEQKTFEVILTVKHRFTVKARNMEAACDKTKVFQEDMKSGDWPKGLCWEDRWVSKVSAAKRLETTTIED